MRVLVTGAAGWSGSAVVGALLEAGHVVVAHDLAQSWEAERARASENGQHPPWTLPAPSGSSCERVEGDLLVAASVRSVVKGCDAVIHTAVLHPPAAEAVGGEDEVSRRTFLVQTNGLFNLLDAIKDTPSVQRFVHVSSCWTAHPDVDFFDASTRRPDWSLYAVSKRIQEEMCEQYHAAHGLQIVMLRPDHIVDSRSGWNRAAPLTSSVVLESQGETGWVCRHDLASACVLAAEKTGLGVEYLSTVGQTPAGKPPPEETCNVNRTKDVLGWVVRGDLEQWRVGSAGGSRL